jgi:hypothetical protein
LSGGGYDSLKLTLNDASEVLDKPISTASTESGKQVPIGFGTCFNVEPVFLSDIGGAHYQLNDGSVHAVTAYRSGGLVLDPARITADLPNGKFSIDPPPTGDVRCDVVFQQLSGVVDIARDLLVRAGVAFDAGNIGAWNVSDNPVAGRYYSSKTTFKTALDDVLSGVGLRYSSYPAGGIHLYRIEQPAAIPVLGLGVGNIVDGSLVFNRVFPPYAVARLGYRLNHAPQEKSGLWGTVSAGDVDAYSREWQTVSITDTGVDENYPAAVRIPGGDVTPTALYFQADATAEANRRMAVFGSPVREFTLEAHEDFLAPLGSVVRITYPRFGFDAGVDAVVTGIRWFPVERRCSLTVWVW